MRCKLFRLLFLLLFLSLFVIEHLLNIFFLVSNFLYMHVRDLSIYSVSCDDHVCHRLVVFELMQTKDIFVVVILTITYPFKKRPWLNTFNTTEKAKEIDTWSTIRADQVGNLIIINEPKARHLIARRKRERRRQRRKRERTKMAHLLSGKVKDRIAQTRKLTF